MKPGRLAQKETDKIVLANLLPTPCATATKKFTSPHGERHATQANQCCNSNNSSSCARVTCLSIPIEVHQISQRPHLFKFDSRQDTHRITHDAPQRVVHTTNPPIGRTPTFKPRWERAPSPEFHLGIEHVLQRFWPGSMASHASSAIARLQMLLATQLPSTPRSRDRCYSSLGSTCEAASSATIALAVPALVLQRTPMGAVVRSQRRKTCLAQHRRL